MSWYPRVAAFHLSCLICNCRCCAWISTSSLSSSDGKQFSQVNEVDCGALDDYHSSVQLWRERQGFFARIFGKRGYPTTVMTVDHDLD